MAVFYNFGNRLVVFLQYIASVFNTSIGGLLQSSNLSTANYNKIYDTLELFLGSEVMTLTIFEAFFYTFFVVFVVITLVKWFTDVFS